MSDNQRDILSQGTILKGLSRSYRIERVLGQGSFGITYLATTQLGGSLGSLEVPVAIKEFFMRDVNGRNGSSVTSGSQGGIYANYRRKFLREAQTLSRLKHKHIVNVLEAFEANNTVYYVMEYMKGGSLDSYIATKGHLSETEAGKITVQIGSALAYMHSHNMLHLDMKPSNVMLDESRMPVLIDFGLSKQYDANGVPESSTSVGGGTPGYAPLEQSEYREGQGLPVTMDVYALGCTMFKMLTGVRPPVASDIMNDGFPAGELQEKDVGESTIHIVAKAMDFRRKNRYQSVDEMMSALRTANPEIVGNGRCDDETQLDGPYANAADQNPQGTAYQTRPKIVTKGVPQHKPPVKFKRKLKQRHGFVTFWLWLGIVVNILTAVYAVLIYIDYFAHLGLGFGDALPVLLSLAVSIINIVAISLLLKWKKTGFYLIIGSAILGIIIISVFLDMFFGLFISFIIIVLYALIWWAILQIKKNGVSAWKQLE